MTAFKKSTPRAQSRCVAYGQSHFLQYCFIQFLSLHQDGNFVDGRSIDALYYCVFIHITEQSNFLAYVATQFVFRAQNQYIRLDTCTLQFLYGVLCRFGFQFTGGCEVRHICKVYTQCVTSQFPLQLTDTFQIWQGFDVAHRTTDFCNYKIEFIFVTQQLYVSFDFVRDMRNDLNGLT